ncbi:MAG TPA: M56 family metallopeptidase [Tepidisphaeraceae bacterium]|nr:M56 family metallopeptidase [Tepidisphaeraceae bacterium]
MLLVASGVTLAMRRSSAGMRHLVWTVAMLSLLVLPVFSAVLPAWRVPFLPTATVENTLAEATITPEPSIPAMVVSDQPSRAVAPLPMPTEASREEAKDVLASPSRLDGVESAERRPMPWRQWVLLGWLVGVLLCLVPLTMGTWFIWRISRRACRVGEGEWAALSRQVRADLSLGRPVTLSISSQVGVPMTWGIGRPMVLLPATAEQWAPARRKVVLQHECAHIKRWDYLTQTVAQVLCALYWFNPLTWLAARQMRVERERASDDLVLTVGSKASEYAQHLVEIAHAARSGSFAGMAAVAMARPGRLESRLLAILDSQRSRRRVTRWAAAGLGMAILLAVVLPISMLRGAAEAPALPGSSVMPQPPGTQPATQPATRPVETGEKIKVVQAAAERFLSALRDRDTAAMGLLIEEVPPHWTKERIPAVVAEFRDKLYARHPERLTEISGTWVYGNSLAAVQAAGPFENSTTGLRMILGHKPDGWRVRYVEESRPGESLDEALNADKRRANGGTSDVAEDTAGASPVKAGNSDAAVDYAGVLALYRALDDRYVAAEKAFEAKDAKALAQAIDSIIAALTEFELSIRGTEIQWPPGTIDAVAKYLSQARDALNEGKWAEGEALIKGWDSKHLIPSFNYGQYLATKADEQEEARRRAAGPTTAPAQRRVPANRTIPLILGWNGQRVSIPGPVSYPQWGRETHAFKAWQRTKDVRAFTTTDDEGNKYVVQAMGFLGLPDGTSRELIPSVSVYRPDGTLKATASYNMSPDQADGWSIYDAAGKYIVLKAYTRSIQVPGKPGDRDGPLVLFAVTFYGEDHSKREWQINRFGVVYSAYLTDAGGRFSVEHLAMQYRDAPYDGPTTQPTTAPAQKPPYAWQSPTYIPPSRDYFPDDADGGRVLDGLFAQLQTDRRPDEEILAAVRKGLRRTTQHRTLILAAIGNRYIWNVSPQHPAAIEIMYHALAFDDLANVGHYAIYFGLSVTKPKTPNVLRAMVEAALRAGYSFDVGRIAWGCADQKEELLAAVREYQTHADPEMRDSAIALEKHFLGQANYNTWKYDQQQQAARKKYRDKLVEVKEQLAHGDTETRRAVINELLRTPDLVLAMDASFLDAWKAAAEDPDVRIRREVARTVGGRWIWSGNEQSEQAVSLMIDLSEDPDPSTRSNAVYFGLSTLRPKPDRVIEALVRVIVEHQGWAAADLYDRVLWGLRGDEQRAADALNAFLETYDSPDHTSAVAALLMHQALVKTESPFAERYANDGSFLIAFAPKPPFSPKNPEELAQELKSLLPADLNVGEIKVIDLEGRLTGGVLLEGYAAQGRLRALLQSSPRLAPERVVLATPEVKAKFLARAAASGRPAK